MQVYSASDGGVTDFQRSLTEYESLAHIINDVAASTDTTPENVLLFLDDGRELRADVLEQLWERGGQASTSNTSILYMFNRDTFWVDAETTAAKYHEEIQLPPQLPLSALSDITQIQHPFLVASDHLSHLQSLFAAQSHAMSIAYANLFHHLAPFVKYFDEFIPRAQQALESEADLIKTAREDMAMLPKIQIHEVFSHKKTMADYVSTRKMEQVRETCRSTHDDHMARFTSLSGQIEELVAQSEAEQRASEERSATVNEEFAQGLARIDMALDQVQVSENVEELITLDQALRQDLVALTNLKNDYTIDLHIHLRQVAHFQSRITDLVQPLSTFDADLKAKTAFPHLARLRQLPFSYTTAVVEVVRRNEFATYLVEWTNRLQENLSRLTNAEIARRQSLADEFSNIPFPIPQLDVSKTVAVEISVASGEVTLPLDRSDIDNLSAWVKSLDNSGLSAHLESLAIITPNLDSVVPSTPLAQLKAQLEESSQAMTAHLETNEQQQAQIHDQNDLIRSLQAELAQEKDRATDLGTRLQGALLDVDGLRNAEQNLVNQVQTLQDERSRSHQALSEAQLSSQNLESQLAGLRAELDATSSQLTEARSERDAALKNQSAEAEKMMRDHIAETDGDRAVLEHQNLTLTKQLETIRGEMDDKLSAARNSAIRQADGLKAELSFTKAQLRDTQRRETFLADGLAMAKDAAALQPESHDAVALVQKYQECCSRLLHSINSSSTITGSLVKPPLPQDEPFDLATFSEAVQKTINLVRKWSKSCKQYRDLARNRISFTTFSKGDLALFLPTRNAVSKSWAAFNVSAPHNFLKMDTDLGNREFIIARIVDTEEAVSKGGNNPFGLADGLQYFVHQVEDYNTTRPRRSTSHSRLEDRPKMSPKRKESPPEEDVKHGNSSPGSPPDKVPPPSPEAPRPVENEPLDIPTHHRTSSRDHPLISLGRVTSASSASPRPHRMPLPSGKSTPAMAITTSNPGSDTVCRNSTTSDDDPFAQDLPSPGPRNKPTAVDMLKKLEGGGG